MGFNNLKKFQTEPISLAPSKWDVTELLAH